MTIRELLDYTSQYLLRDHADPQLWPDELLLIYLAEAESLFARRTHTLLDYSSPLTNIITRATEASYPLDKRIVWVQEVRLSTGEVLSDTTRKRVPRGVYEGKPRFYTLDSGAKTLRLYPTPDDEYTLELTVARTPLRKIHADREDQTPEIPEDYHTALCEYAAWKALRNNDSDASAGIDANEFLTNWELSVKQHKREIASMQAGPNPRARASWTFKRK